MSHDGSEPALNATDIPSFDSQVLDGHFACRIDIPEGMPRTWSDPSALLVASVNRKMTGNTGYIHYVYHKHFVMFVATNQGTSNEILECATTTLNRLKEPATRTFKLHVQDIGALNLQNLRQLLACLGGMS